MREHVRTAAVLGLLIGALTLGALAQTPVERRLELSFPAEGVVTLVASHVTVREILAEWTRQTGAVFTNAERLIGDPITVQYDRMPEAAVVDSLLRSAAGYFVAPRDPERPVTSTIAFVYIIPTSQGSPAGTYVPPLTSPAVTPPLTPGSPNDEIPPVTPIVPNPPGAIARDPSAPPPPGVIVPITPVVGPGGGRGGGFGSSPTPATGRGSGS